MSTQSQQSDTSSGAPSSPSSSLPKLGPAWYRAAGGHKGGFRPPPAVPLVDGNDGSSGKRGGSQRDRAESVGSGSAGGGNVNSFSALLHYDDDDDEPRPSNSTTGGGGGSKSCNEGSATSQPQNPRSDALLGSSAKPFQRTLSGGERGGIRPAGRTLADLAASVPAPGTGRTSSVGYSRKTESGGGRSSEDAGFRRSVDDPDKPVTRYTREKLLAMRPASASSIPDDLKHLEGIVILADQAQDPGKLFFTAL